MSATLTTLFWARKYLYILFLKNDLNQQKHRLIQVWSGLEQTVVDKATDEPTNTVLWSLTWYSVGFVRLSGDIFLQNFIRAQKSLNSNQFVLGRRHTLTKTSSKAVYNSSIILQKRADQRMQQKQTWYWSVHHSQHGHNFTTSCTDFYTVLLSSLKWHIMRRMERKTLLTQLLEFVKLQQKIILVLPKCWHVLKKMWASRVLKISYSPFWPTYPTNNRYSGWPLSLQTVWNSLTMCGTHAHVKWYS